ncbi:MAG TPA: hypothetical protein VHL78_04205 [Actinomycetota bacterium]|nr:hypothetical protein [Actinomycetota bacterium]
MSRELIRRYVEANHARDFDALRGMRHPGWTAEWPQSGERVPSHDADVAIHEAYPGYPAHQLAHVAGRDERWTLAPTMTPVRVVGAGGVWAAELLLDYGDGRRYHSPGIVELRDGLVWRETVYWAAPFEAPAWRADLVEAIEAGAVDVSADGGPEEEEAHVEAVRRYADAAAAGDLASALRGLYHEDAVEDIPQSGERVRGVERMIAIVERHPATPRLELRRAAPIGNVVLTEKGLRYGDDLWLEFAVKEFRGDRVARVTEYFAQPFEAPEWRARWVERL